MCSRIQEENEILYMGVLCVCDGGVFANAIKRVDRKGGRKIYIQKIDFQQWLFCKGLQFYVGG